MLRLVAVLTAIGCLVVSISGGFATVLFDRGWFGDAVVCLCICGL